MGSKRKIMALITIMILFSMTLGACAGVGGSVKDDPNWSDDPDSASPAAGGGVDPGEESEEPEEEDGGDELAPVALDACHLDTEYIFAGIDYEKVTWNGPPQVVLGPANFNSLISYSYDEDNMVGSISLEQSPSVGMPITITFPDCRSTPYIANTSFSVEASGTCKGDQVSITFYEKWESVTLQIPCEKGSEVCGDEKSCEFPYQLPFAMAGKAGLEVVWNIRRDTAECIPHEQTLSFAGAGGSGTKTYWLMCK